MTIVAGYIPTPEGRTAKLACLRPSAHTSCADRSEG
jgi:hypothetical protein